ncbi:MAG: SusD/RagB family nutrient-binding outer membrane lipoprotein [Sphingobacterium sp.]
MKKNIRKGFILLAACGMLQSCTKDFVAINTNPNAISAAAPQSLIAPALLNVLNTNLSRNMRINNELMQVTVTVNDALEIQRYEIRPSEAESTWSGWYVQLTNIRDIYQKAGEGQQKGYQTYQGISLILDAWVSSLITDMYGDVPYTDSNKGYSDSNLTPVFDKQADIYADIFRKLEEANTLLKGKVAVESTNLAMDPIFNSDPAKWQKFGNSLYLRLLLRIAHKSETNAVAKIKEILETNAAEYPVMQSNAETAALYYTNVQPYMNPYFNSRDIDFNGNKGYSEFFINNLLDLSDPRLKIWATEATLGVYGGMQSGYQRGNVPEQQSTLLTSLKADSHMGNIMNYAELQFIIAECGMRGYAQVDAPGAYLKGVNAAMEYWGLTAPASYLSSAKVQLLPTDSDNAKLKKVHLQKYYAMLFTDFQQWYEYRRTQLLDLYKGPGLLNQGKMPVRLNYPTIVQSLNKVNYQDAVSRMGGDGINEKMWWQPSIN